MLKYYKVYCHNRENSEKLVLKIGFDQFYVVKYFKKSKSKINCWPQFQYEGNDKIVVRIWNL